MKIFLASSSKIRHEILNKCGLKNHVIKSNYQEKHYHKDVQKYVEELAYFKAINTECNHGIILGLDTVLYLDGQIIEKPKSKEEAILNIKKCMDKEIFIYTGVAIYFPETKKVIIDSQKTKIKLRKIEDKDINYYINNEKEYLYAAGFIIETILSNFIEYIEGSFYNILGTPVELIYKHLHRLGYYLEDFE